MRGQGPRAEADAAHGVHACESRDAGRAPPSSFDSASRLGRRAEAGPRRVLPRVSRPFELRAHKLTFVRLAYHGVTHAFFIWIVKGRVLKVG